jgi:hypothetical protein
VGRTTRRRRGTEGICEADGVSSTPIPAEDAAPSQKGGPASAMPTSVRVSVIVLSILAGLLLLNAGLTWFGREQVIAALADGGNISRAEARRFVLLWLVPYLTLGLILASAAWFLPRRRPWARWLGLAATTILGLLTLFSVVVSGGVTVGSLLLLVLSIAGVTSLVSRSTAAWVPRPRARG